VQFRDASRALLRATTVEAMRGLLEERPWSSITMSDVAAAAGVSRQTLYNTFGDRDGLVDAYVRWAADRFLDQVEATIGEHGDDIEAALLASFEAFLSAVHDDPLVSAIEAKSGISGVSAFVAEDVGNTLLEVATERLIQIVDDAWPGLPSADLDLAAETIVRLALSHMVIPAVAPAVAAERVRAAMAPFIAVAALHRST
jgi:AcrR family transcriptional regulator